MSYTLFDAAWRVETMVGRQQELERIKKAIYGRAEDKSCRVVLITGPGGIGKSRLLEEVQWRAGHPDVRREAQDRGADALVEREDWTGLGRVTVSDTIDLLDIRLTARGQILQALRRALARVGGVDFESYEAAERAYLERLRASASFDQIKQHADAAERAFWQDFQAHAQTQRLVLILDTAERLVLRSSEWAIERGLLKPEEMVLSSQEWIRQQLADGRFQNTTLILAGRAEEGEPFFRRLKSTLQQVGIPWQEIDLQALSEDETVWYFRHLAREWQERARTANGSRINGDYGRISRFMEALAEDWEQLKVLYLATGGRPVLLALYGDLIHESEEIPELLRLRSEEIEKRIEADGRKAIQGEIERAFISVLFQRPGLRSDIMQALARCPAGLNAEQLHFLLDSNGQSDPSTWKPSIPRVEEIQGHLDQIRRLSIARPRPDGRLGLQDEIYRIYAQRMSDRGELRSYEADQRQSQYRKLSLWSEKQLQEWQAQLRVYHEEDEKRIAAAIRVPNQALRPYIPPLTSAEQEDRARAQQEIWNWELEKLHYELLRDPAVGLNEDYTDLTARRWYDNNEEADFITQQEMWRVLYDEYALLFTRQSSALSKGDSSRGYSEDEIRRFRSAAAEEDPTRWIKRFILRRQYARAIEFCDAVQRAIDLLPEEERASWQRPINAGERSIWRGYAKIMLGQDVSGAVNAIEEALKSLEAATPSLGEKARIRQSRVLGIGYNFAGYGYAAPLGQFKLAVDTYGKALRHTRQTRSTAQQAGIRNNLARALASLGREERGYRVCADALQIRRSLGVMIPVATSLNTLALINNAMERIPTAWREAAQAAAIFRQSGDDRGLGLALIQLAIGLRRLANSRASIDVLEATPGDLYTTAQLALGEAIAIFKGGPEVLRWVEATLEMGCVLRDQMRLIDAGRAAPQEQRRLGRLYRDAQIEFGRAIDTADKYGFKYLALQAQVDLAWAHFFADLHGAAASRYVEAEKTAKAAEKCVPPEYFVTEERRPPHDANETHHFYQLAKLQGLYAAIAMERFKARREELRSAFANNRQQLYEELKRDQEAADYLRQAAESYVLSLYYGQLFSPRSRSLVITFDQIYEHVKGFNPVEYHMFYQAQRQAAGKYRRQEASATSEKPPFDFSNLESWLDDCFGSLPEETDEPGNQDV